MTNYLYILFFKYNVIFNVHFFNFKKLLSFYIIYPMSKKIKKAFDYQIILSSLLSFISDDVEKSIGQLINLTILKIGLLHFHFLEALLIAIIIENCQDA